MHNKVSSIYAFLLNTMVLLALAACGNKTANTKSGTVENTVADVPEFNADSAFQSIVTQCGFGPRVCETNAHEQCGEYITKTFQRYGMQVTRQEAEFKRYDGVTMKGFNIIAENNPSAKDRVLIAAHWDSRPWADNDENPDNHKKPIDAANDGASGVAVMLELARIIAEKAPSTAVDFICFDAEDMGTPKWDEKVEDNEDTWCLGSQHWAQNPHHSQYEYGVLLDMVGGQGAHFSREGYSMRFAGHVVERVWNAARNAGYSSYFPRSEGGYIMDDHIPVNQTAKIPMIDIVPYYPDGTGSFGPTWHTISDTPENIDKNTLKAVGQTLLQLIYN